MDNSTGLLDPKDFLARVDDEARRAVRFSRPLGLIVVTWAQQQEFPESKLWISRGFGMLRQLARVISNNLRDIDVAGRVDGPILGVLLPETNLAGTRIVAQRICRDAQAFEFTGETLDDVVRLSVNAGYTAWTETQASEHGHEMLDRARRALDRAFSLGPHQSSGND